jgi:hypothetical protein
MELLSFHGRDTIESHGGSDFAFPDLFCRFSAAERREAAVECGADRLLFFLIDGTIYFLA